MFKKKLPIVLSLLVTILIGVVFGIISIFYFKTYQHEKNRSVLTEFKNEQKMNVHKNINKVKITELTTNYVDYLKTNVFKFDDSLIKKNLYPYMSQLIKKETNFNEQQYKLNLSVYYHLNFNNDYLKILVNWTTRPINSLNSEFVKQYYDVFDVSLRKK